MAGPRASAEAVAKIEEDYGLNEPLPQQYLDYISGVVQLDERVDDYRVEMVATQPCDFVDRFTRRPRPLIRPFARESVIHVGHGGDARRERNLSAAQSVRVPAPIPPFVV